jgi:hypothetical protein
MLGGVHSLVDGDAMTGNAELLVLLIRSTILATRAHRVMSGVVTMRECEEAADLKVLDQEAERRGWEKPRKHGWTIDPYPEET